MGLISVVNGVLTVYCYFCVLLEFVQSQRFIQIRLTSNPARLAFVVHPSHRELLRRAKTAYRSHFVAQFFQRNLRTDIGDLHFSDMENLHDTQHASISIFFLFLYDPYINM